MAKPKEAADAADERSGPTTQEIAESYFAEDFWPAIRVILWIAFRDINRLVEYGFKPAIEAILAAALHRPERLRDDRPRQTLLQALQRGHLAAIRDGAELQPEAWAAASWQHWADSLRFRRKEVLRCWPPAGQESAATEALAGHLNNNPQMTRAAEKQVAQPRGQLKQTRARPEVDRATDALKVLYPDDNIPDQRSVPNKVLLKKVNDCLRSMTPPLQPVKTDSLLRAADRRK